MSVSPRVQERLITLFRDKLNVDIPNPTTDLFDTGLLDSVMFVELLLLLEQQFGVTVSLDDLEIDNFRSVARIAEKALVLHSVAAAAARIIVFRGLIPHPSCWMFGAPCCACSFLAAPLWLLPLHLRKKHRPHLP